MKVLRFTKNNIDTFYLSPYIEYTFDDEKLVLRNDLFAKVLIAPQLKKDPEKTMQMLKEGIPSADAVAFVRDNFVCNDPQQVLEAFLQNGILE
ncbi:MAG: hypothetical protein K9G58_14705 [Bacteroidales bacterium]|nr:hypothetical protein [Bacteroidales bacterium]MCF8387896.1 hypothetical protein [Bacteroidales bacterium]MCF8399421.1 hypothetical protein [Bacteroidales bacterium]